MDDIDIDQVSAEAVAQHGPFMLMPAGVITTGQPTYDEWFAAMTWVQQVEKASPFWIGDLLSFGEAAYGEKYSQAVEATGHKASYLMNVASVASKIPVERRHPDLSFAHHQDVAALPEAEQEQWLDKAQEEDWTSKDLRNHIRVSKAKQAGKTLELGVWVACADEDDQRSFYDRMIADGRAAKKTVKELA